MRLSLAAGKAFVDFNAPGSLTSYTKEVLVTIRDSAGHTLTGYISAAGTGETYGSQLLANSSLGTSPPISPPTTKATLSTIASGGGPSRIGPYLKVALAPGAYGGGLFSVSACPTVFSCGGARRT